MMGRSLRQMLRGRPSLDPLFERAAALSDSYYASLFYGVILGYVLLLLSEAASYSSDARLFPLLVGLPLAIMLFGKVIIELSDPLAVDVSGPFDAVLEEIPTYQNDDEVGPARRYRREVEMLLWVGCLPVLIWLLGFFLATLVFIPAFVYRQERRLKRGLLVSGITTGALYVLFVRILSATLHRGVLFELL